MKITCDDREPQQMLAMCRKEGMEVERKRLKVGDYICEDVCIERKTINDFCGSIMNGRMSRQIANMKKKYQHNYVLVSRPISKRSNVNFHEHAILGKIASLLVKSQVNVLMLESDRHLVYIMKKIFIKHIQTKDIKR